MIGVRSALKLSKNHLRVGNYCKIQEFSFNLLLIIHLLSFSVSSCLASSFVTKFDSTVDGLPLRDAVRYAEKNLKFTAGEFLVSSNHDMHYSSYFIFICFYFIKYKNHSEAHANALLEYEFKQGDVLALWLPNIAEKVCSFINPNFAILNLFVIACYNGCSRESWI
jgi:hypothetical protein